MCASVDDLSTCHGQLEVTGTGHTIIANPLLVFDTATPQYASIPRLYLIQRAYWLAPFLALSLSLSIIIANVTVACIWYSNVSIPRLYLIWRAYWLAPFLQSYSLTFIIIHHHREPVWIWYSNVSISRLYLIQRAYWLAPFLALSLPSLSTTIIANPSRLLVFDTATSQFLACIWYSEHIG